MSTTSAASVRRAGLVLLAAAAAVGLVGLLLGAGYPNIAAFFLMPLLSGLGFLVAAAAGGRGGPLWPAALTTAFWGALIVLTSHGLVPLVDGSPRDTMSIAVYFGSAVVAGLLAYAVVRLLGLRGRPASLAIVVAVSVTVYAAALAGVPGVVGWWLYPVLMAATAGPLLVRARAGVPA